MIPIQLTITDQALGLTREMAKRITPAAVAKVAARGVANAIRDNFQELENTRPNKKGWPRVHLWSRMRQATQNPAPAGSPGLLTVVVNHLAAAQRFFGGIIRALNADFLTLPARAEAYGHRAREFDKLKFGFMPDPELGGKLRPSLYEPEWTEVKFGKERKDGTRRVKQGKARGGIFYWLARKVVQQPDRTVLPSDEQLMAAAIEPAQEFIANETGGKQ